MRKCKLSVHFKY